MTYTFKYTEKNAKKGSEFETKALLYLIGIDKDRDEIQIAFIDCFNDLSGCDESHSKLWDCQSKGVANMNPEKIGRSLVTLYLNNYSKLNFVRFALFMPAPKSEYICNAELTSFGIGNFNKKSAQSISKGLKKELSKRNEVIKDDNSVSEKVAKFLDKVEFIIDRMDPNKYVRALTKFKDKEFKSNQFYDSIFKDIQDQQVAKKNSLIEGMRVNAIIEALRFKRHILSRSISQLIISRIVGIDLFNSRNIPVAFINEVKGLDTYAIKELINDCNASVCRALFDKNKKNVFWIFLESVMKNIVANDPVPARTIYDKSVVPGLDQSDLSGVAGVYFISLVMEGIQP